MGNESTRVATEFTPEFQSKSPLDFLKISPGGIGTDTAVTEQFQKAMKAQDDYANSLERRFAQPNWFNVAAGFAQPTLSGFFGSLGNASRVLGEQQEAQKAVAPTIARMRAEVAAGQLGFEQRTSQKKMFDDIKAGKLPMDEKTLQKLGEFGTETDIYKAAKDYFTTQSTRQDQVINAMVAQKNLTGLYAQYGVQWVNNQIDQIRKRFPGLETPPGYIPSEGGSASAAPSAAPGPATSSGPTVSPSAPPAPAPTPPAIQGAPGAGEMPRGAQVEAQSQQTTEKIAATRKTSDELSNQATQGSKLFEAASAVYKAAAKPTLQKAFGLFERGDALGVIGRALEKQNVSEALADVRQQLTNLRLGAKEKDTLISDFQAFEKALAGLQYQIQQGVTNPTDLRTKFEASSIPNVKDTQDAFLRGMARLASDGLSQYELNQAFQKIKNKPDFDIYDWQTSQPYADVMNAANKRTIAAITNPASYTPPDFIQRGLQGGSSPSAARPAASATTPKAEDRTNKTVGSNGNTWEKRGNKWVDTGVKAP